MVNRHNTATDDGSMGRFYELALSLGSSLDLEASCRTFLRHLVPALDLAAARVWVRPGVAAAGGEKGDDVGAVLAAAEPAAGGRSLSLDADHPLLSAGRGGKLILTSDDDGFAGTATLPALAPCVVALFSLGEVGVLELYSTRHEDAFSGPELAGLDDLLESFGRYLEACGKHEALARELIERRVVEKALRQDRDRAQATLASIADGLIRTDAEGRIDYLNPAAEELSGWQADRVLGHPTRDVYTLAGELDREPLADPVERCLATGRAVGSDGNATLVRGDGKEVFVSYRAVPLREAAGAVRGALLVLRDVTHLRHSERRMSYLATHDPLTGLLNRREFEVRLRDSLRRVQESGEGRRHIVFYLDLDEFKRINDTCGHLAGDEMLKQITSILLTKVRATDVLARLGGDEFGVLLQDCPFDRALEIADNLREAVKSFRFSWDEKVFQIGVSIGVVPVGSSGDMDHLMRAADATCYVAKQKGRNRIQISQPDDAAVAARFGDMQWIQRLEEALEKGSFRLFYQSIRRLGGEEPPTLEGEMLVRMEEDGDLVPPAAFLSAAERYHLMGALDLWVVRAACQGLQQAGGGGEGQCFGLNISGQSLEDPSFEDAVSEAVRSSGLPPARLCFEISEAAAVANLSRTQRFMAVLKKLGCCFCLDDFGSGLSSFGYLRNLPVDFLKIDGELVRDVASDPVQRALVESVQNVARVMGVQTVAEWVEEKEILEALSEIGVGYAQGYWISAPRPLEAVLAPQQTR